MEKNSLSWTYDNTGLELLFTVLRERMITLFGWEDDVLEFAK